MIHAFIVLAVVGFCLWLLITYVPMPAPFKQVIIAIAVLFLIVFVLQTLGVTGTHLTL